MKQDKPKLMTVGDLIDMLDSRKKNKNKYRIKVSYGSKNPEDDYRFDMQSAMRDKR